MVHTPRLKEKYLKEIKPFLQKKIDYKSIMQVPQLCSIHINQGVANAKSSAELLKTCIEEITLIAGQRAIPTKAKKAISNFKLREGMQIGVKVDLRGKKMYTFLDRFINFALPRVRDFSGISEKSFDKQGNYTYGVKEHIIFPEISIEKLDKIRGMNITFVTSTSDVKASYELLKAFGMPFKNMHETT